MKHQGVEIDHQELAKNAVEVGLQLHLVKDRAGFTKTTKKHNRVFFLLASNFEGEIAAGRKTDLPKQRGEPALDFVIVGDEVGGQDRSDGEDKGKGRDKL